MLIITTLITGSLNQVINLEYIQQLFTKTFYKPFNDK